MTIVILGGGIAKDSRLPEYVKKRLEKAWQIFKGEKGVKILVCGKYSFLYPKNEVPKKTEAKAMKDYLLTLGVPRRNIYLESKSKDTIGNAYYAKKLYFIPKRERKAAIITSDFHLKRVKFVFKKVFGRNYQFRFIGMPSLVFQRKKKIKSIKRQKELLKNTKKFLSKMKSGNHNFLKGKLYKMKYYKEKRPAWVIKFVAQGK